MKENKSEGIVLKSFAYKETERILHLFTHDQGIIHLIVKHLSPKKPQRINLSTPLCRGQYVYRKGKSDLYTLLDGSILNLHLPLRQSLKQLTIGGKMLQAIHDTQLPEKPAPQLYNLLAAYLKNLPLSPENLWASFQLKLLKHEGLISFSKPQINSALGIHTLTEEEWNHFLLLAEGRDFSTLTAFTPPESLKKSIHDIFSSFIKL
ncbi:DNA repair protein RecO [Simkania negevensis]|uniref:Putative DNA repair protein recO n=1 Tax=Simkania negevensis (strain ATCC VR-1471 / DSM 27360 / Z) TaxID=331113 RepID=F8L3D8_SIMNZ|nr:DNA repair protein RecO [Simkania negevensis]CCB89786.1 putative DNA repair protein recO [Simkania negevensis Z]